MLMHEGLYAIDLDVMLTLIRAILQTFLECVELILDMKGRVAAKLDDSFKNVLACHKGPEG